MSLRAAVRRTHRDENIVGPVTRHQQPPQLSNTVIELLGFFQFDDRDIFAKADNRLGCILDHLFVLGNKVGNIRKLRIFAGHFQAEPVIRRSPGNLNSMR